MSMVSVAVSAQIPSGYYRAIDGESGADLKLELCNIIAPHTVYSYDDLWETYEVTDVVPGTKYQVRELYSNDVIYYTRRGTLINREHTVPQSWWGKGNISNAYTDLINVMPAEAKANNAKSNYPLGVVDGAVMFDNGVTKVGTSTNSGGANRVFEPADQYKGDFARIYFYVATCYSSAPWTDGAYSMQTTGLTLQPWTIETLLKWNEQDPVDEQEMKRNEACYYLQNNRNPFVDYPQLAQYIWGTKRNEQFRLSVEQPNVPKEQYRFVFKAGRPSYSVQYGETEAEAQGVAEGTSVKVTSGNSISTLYYKVDDAKWDSVPCDTNRKYYSPSKTLKIENRERATCIQAFTSKEGRANSDTIVAYYIVDDKSDYLVYEDFAVASAGDNTSTNGASSAKWKDAIFTTNVNAYSAGGAVKLGTGSNPGSLSTDPIAFDGGPVEVSIDVKGWTTIEGDLIVTFTGENGKVISREFGYSAKISDPFQTIKFELDNVPANPVVTIATSKKRAFVDNIIISAKATAISDVQADNGPAVLMHSYDDAYYDLQGRRFKVVPEARGIYIYMGKKVVIR